MRILFIVPYTPNLVRVRPYNLIRALATAGHELTLLCVYENETERQQAAALETICRRVVALPLPRWRTLWNCIGALPGREPLQAAYCWQPAGARALSELLGGQTFDVVHVEHLRGARYGLAAGRMQVGQNGNGHRPVPVIWDSVDNISHLFRQASGRSRSLFGRWMTRFELGRTERYEAEMYGRFDRVLVTSPADCVALESLVEAEKRRPGHVAVLPNGVDLDTFTPGPAGEREPATLVVSGKMSYHANVTMVLHLAQAIMPHIWAERPDVQLQIVGKDPAPAVQALAEEPRITVTGTVPAVAPYLQRATVAVAPLTYGAGIQNKVLEAMACATPVVTTPGVLAALQAHNGRELLAESEPEAFAAAVLALLDDSGRRAAIGVAGRNYVERYHDWQQIGARLVEIYQQAVDGVTEGQR